MESASGNHFLHLQKEENEYVFSLSVAGIARLPLNCSKRKLYKSSVFVYFSTEISSSQLCPLSVVGLRYAVSSAADWKSLFLFIVSWRLSKPPKKWGNSPTSCDCYWEWRKFYSARVFCVLFFLLWAICFISITTNIVHIVAKKEICTTVTSLSSSISYSLSINWAYSKRWMSQLFML